MNGEEIKKAGSEELEAGTGRTGPRTFSLIWVFRADSERPRAILPGEQICRKSKTETLRDRQTPRSGISPSPFSIRFPLLLILEAAFRLRPFSPRPAPRARMAVRTSGTDKGPRETRSRDNPHRPFRFQGEARIWRKATPIPRARTLFPSRRGPSVTSILWL